MVYFFEAPQAYKIPIGNIGVVIKLGIIATQNKLIVGSAALNRANKLL